MKGGLRAVAVGLTLALGGCEKPDPVSAQELTEFAASNPDYKKMDLEKLNGVVSTLGAARAYRQAAGRDQYLDLRTPYATKEYGEDPKYKDFPYVRMANLIESGVLWDESNPWSQAYDKEKGRLSAYMYETLYTVVTDEGSGRSVLKIEQGNLLRPGDKDSNASYTTTIDLETGIVTSLDDGPGPLDAGGFQLGHDETGKVVEKKERGSHWNNNRLDAILSSTIREMEDLAKKLEEETNPVGDVSSDVHERIDAVGK